MITDVNVLPIILTLDVNRVNIILRSLGKHPFDEINELIRTILYQGETQVAEWRQQIAEQSDEKELNSDEIVKKDTESDLDVIIQDESVLDEVVA